MSRRWVNLFLAAVAIAALTAAILVSIDSETEPEISVLLDWTVADRCPDAVLIGAAGSGQRDDVLGVGPQVESVVSAFTTHLEEKASQSVSAGFVALDYPAPGILEGALQAFRGDDSMADSVSQGRDTLITLVETIEERCEESVVYLIGFSQGASVVHTAVVEMPQELQDRIGGVVVLADPYRDADEPNAEHFTTEPDPENDRTETPHTRDGSLSGLPVPDWVAGSFYSACARRDTVCNFALRDLLATGTVHSDETYNGLGPQLGAVIASDLLKR